MQAPSQTGSRLAGEVGTFVTGDKGYIADKRQVSGEAGNEKNVRKGLPLRTMVVEEIDNSLVGYLPSTLEASRVVGSYCASTLSPTTKSARVAEESLRSSLVVASMTSTMLAPPL
jgi:hypothetical protein